MVKLIRTSYAMNYLLAHVIDLIWREHEGEGNQVGYSRGEAPGKGQSPHWVIRIRHSTTSRCRQCPGTIQSLQ